MVVGFLKSTVLSITVKNISRYNSPTQTPPIELSPMKPTKEMIDKAARRGALLQNVQVIMWEFTKKRESDESVDWIEYAKKIIDLVEGKNKD